VTCGYGALAVAGFHGAFEFSPWLILVFLFATIRLASAPSARIAFWVAFLTGYACYAVHLSFFWNIFKQAAVALWCIPALWTAIFVILLRAALKRFGPVAGLLAAPVLWTGIEYFRSELYYLRFTWATPGLAFSNDTGVVQALGGVYGAGFWLMAVAVVFHCFVRLGWKRQIFYFCAAVLAGTFLSLLIPAKSKSRGGSPQLNYVGLSIFQEGDLEVIRQLDLALAAHPYTDVFILGEYAFDEAVPRRVREWCARHQRHLIAGGKDEQPDGAYYNTAFVISTNGEVVFKQAKCVPIQFFNDGLPAPSQQVWESPWGRIGFGICYDLSFTRVMDRVIAQKPQALIIPTMDLNDWGAQQQRLHTRIAPVRAVEYGVPVLRVCTEGISQHTQPTHQIVNIPGVPHPAIQGTLALLDARQADRLRPPVDRFLAPLCTGLTALFMLSFPLAKLAARFQRAAASPPSQS
jgi:apolipoprotein N-acyltransferase